MATLKERHGASERRACKVASQARSTERRKPRANEEEKRLRARIHELVRAWPRRGYKYITRLLRREGWRVNKKRVLRIWREEGLRVPRKPCRKRRLGSSANATTKLSATKANEVWAWDFFHDRLEDGRAVKWLSLVDEFTRECLLLYPARSITHEKAKELLMKRMTERGAPVHLRSDNGPEFIARGLRDWLSAKGVGPAYIEPGAPWENGFAESFHSRVRAEFINLELFRTYTEARVVGEQWRQRWNTRRLHGSLGYQTPEEFAARHKADKVCRNFPSPRGEGSQAPTGQNQETLITAGT